MQRKFHNVLLGAALCWLGAAASMPAMAQTTTVAGTMPGQFSVNESGAATYRIPIQVPPGVAGMEPKLELAYNSQGGNGLLGMGWSLGGLSAISRCPRTLAQDGVRGSVNFDMNDRYCMDGQRLVLVSGSYGVAGSEYRTELDSFSKIVASGTAGNGVASFTVQTKAGLTLEYGNTADSRVEASGKPSVRAWAINRISDVKTNYMTFSYAEVGATGDHYPSRIDYAGNVAAGRLPTSSVRFVVETRPDAPPLYHAGSFANNAVRLKTIQTFSDAAALKEYRLSYTLGVATGRSKVTQLQACVANTCLPPVAMAFTDAPNRFTPYSAWSTGHSANDKLGDFNGDGKTDIIQTHANGNAYVWLSTGTGFAPAAVWSTGHSENDKLGDFNGDGKTDVIQTHSNGNAYVWLSTGTGFAPAAVWSTGHSENDKPGDFNGDGRTDVIQTHANGNAYVWLSTGTGFTSAAVWSTGHSEGDKLGDFNGDGKTDVFQVSSGGTGYVWLSTGANFLPFAAWSSGHTSSDQLGDFNGDGKTDVFQASSGGSGYVWLSTGAVFLSPGVWGTGHSMYDKLGDFNGDGKTDVIRTHSNGSSYVWLSNGKTFEPWTHWSTSGHAEADKLGDFNGDGKTDVFQVSSGGTGYVWLSDGPMPDLLAQVDNTQGAVTSLISKPLTDSSVYVKDGGFTYPRIDLQPSQHVVASVTSSNGVGGTTTTQYNYGGLKAEQGTGRGMLGFRWMKSKNLSNNIESYTEFNQNWPLTGTVAKSETRLAGSGNTGVLKRTTNTYAQGVGSAAGTTFVYPSQSIEESWDLGGSAYPTVTNTYQYGQSPQYGDPTQISVINSAGAGKTTGNEYWPANTGSGSWVLGRLKKATVTSVTP
ncbi:FG-GAP-like repeat-containing protein [Polaromonas sp. LjRoot131]|uniref:FG-GAP-like repeat-containing protein n=1 Tax=Polaromonas sp. LjRoot131 TaxID=3342262 RepID=UPI003ECEED47